MAEDADPRLRDTLTQIARSAADLTGSACAAIVLVDERRNLTLVAGSGADSRFPPAAALAYDALGVVLGSASAGHLHDLPEESGVPPGVRRGDRNLVATRVPSSPHAQAYGVLYLGGGSGAAGFSAAQEKAVTVLADAAGMALEHAQIVERERRHQQLLETTAKVTSLLLKHDDPGEALQEVVRSGIRQVCGADVSAVFCAEGAPNQLLVIAVDGLGLDKAPVTQMSSNSLVGRVLESGREVVSEDLPSVPGYNPPEEWREALSVMGPGMLVPLVANTVVLGVLQVGWRRDSPNARNALSQRGMVCAFAHQAALGLQHLRAEEERTKLLVLKERERIASELGDSVIESLSAADLDLHSAAGLSRQAEVRRRVDAAIGSVETSIQVMRDTIFQTRPPSQQGAPPVWQSVLDELDSVCVACGTQPRLVLTGQLDRESVASARTELTAAVHDTLAVTTTEASTSVEVTVGVAETELVLTVTDSGRGVGEEIPAARLSGLERRARSQGGWLAVRRSDGGTTSIEWHIPAA